MNNAGWTSIQHLCRLQSSESVPLVPGAIREGSIPILKGVGLEFKNAPNF